MKTIDWGVSTEGEAFVVEEVGLFGFADALAGEDPNALVGLPLIALARSVDKIPFTPAIVIAAFVVAGMLMVPITPGGLGTVDALMISLLQSTGASAGAATAADLVWRAASYVPQIIVGIVALVLWFKKANRAFAAAK